MTGPQTGRSLSQILVHTCTAKKPGGFSFRLAAAISTAFSRALCSAEGQSQQELWSMAAPLPELRKLELLPLQLPDCGIAVTCSASMLRSELDVLSFLSNEGWPPIFGGESMPTISEFKELFVFLKLPEVRFPSGLFRSTFCFFAGCFSAEQISSIPQMLLGTFTLDSEPPITLLH
jgi:hypothetical protein